ncbi:ribosomal protein L7/L12 C-terminal domain-domain-containing protein [Protomyces lactucae-debilis]|uniref:Ribosomal protein L7/L12 C-terminal domain-domain-containing protein n=1 Tax=Protomyces lactucae-debilis TaxID=2754530 RepID=A0A1Y2FWT5_PROLT|nr:ribosomal protein L7/L12 C-terminal domain-containing protein [Protomyces lactucae-debilis]ORY87764.1 ribosomal protein L7/L12 C-terminal domain-domain-containing protein [Protomyces lactucae-debilis]
MLSRSTRQVLRLACRATRTQTRSNTTATNAKIDDIVSSISKLSLLETADLIQSLKTKLNISEVAAPVATGGTAAATGAAAAAPAVADEPEKTVFNLKLTSFDAASKAKIIREVKAMLGLNLVDAKKFVESAPKVLKEGVTKEDAEKIKKALEAVGGKVDLE